MELANSRIWETLQDTKVSYTRNNFQEKIEGEWCILNKKDLKDLSTKFSVRSCLVPDFNRLYKNVYASEI